MTHSHSYRSHYIFSRTIYTLLLVFFVSIFGCSSSDFKKAREHLKKGKIELAEAIYLDVVKNGKPTILSRLPLIKPAGVKAGYALIECCNLRTEHIPPEAIEEKIMERSVFNEELLTLAKQYPYEKRFRKYVTKFLTDTAWYFLEDKEPDKARKLLLLASDISEGYADLYYVLGIIEWLEQDLLKAELYFKKTLKIDGKHIRAMESLANLKAMEDK